MPLVRECLANVIGMARHSSSPEVHSRNALLTPGIIAVLVAGGLFIVLAVNVVTGSLLVLLDAEVTTWLQTHRIPALTLFLTWFTNLHAMLAIGVYTTILAFVLAYKREWRWLLTVGLVVPGGLALNWLLKQAYQRARPAFDEPLLILNTYSFPSAHTAGAVLLYGVLAAFLITRLKNTPAKIGCVVAAVLLAALVGFSRIYLGVHYLSDVLAAASASTAWLVMCLVSGLAYSKRRGNL